MNKILKKNSSFTLIELLVVIVIIGVLAGIVAVATSHFISTSHNTKLVGELSNLSKMLQGRTYYPAGNFCIEDDSNEDAKRFRIELGLDKVPKHPQYNDGDTHLTTNNCFLYFSDGDEYSIRLPALGNEGYLIQESRNPIVRPIQKSCDEGWIPFGNRCIMQFEAAKASGNNCKNSAGQAAPCPVSAPTAWAGITQPDAKAACESIGAHLITNAEWMAIARDIEAQDENWVYESGIDKDILKRGNVNKTDAGSYGNNAKDNDTPVNEKARLKLSNGQTIYHFSGNVWEWLDEVRTTDELKIAFPGSLPTDYSSHKSYFNNNSNSPLPYIMAGSKGNFNSDQVGYFWSRNSDNASGDCAQYGDCSDHAFMRGGSWDNGADAGVFALHLGYSPSDSSTDLGFRCAR